MNSSTLPHDIPPPITEPEKRDLHVTIHSVEGLNFLTELGSQQIGVSVLFPTHTNDSMSPLMPPAPKITYEFTESFTLTIHPQTTVNALLANPLEFFLYIATSDFKKQNQVARFVLPFDDLIFNSSFSTTIDGTVLQEGQSVLSHEGLKASVECSWSKPLFDPATCKESLIATFNVGSITALPQALLNCVSQPNSLSSHIFSYSIYAVLPDKQILYMEDGKFVSTAPDGSDASIVFSSTQKFFLGPESFEIWKEESENEKNISIFIIPELLPQYQALSIPTETFQSLFARVDLPLSHFSKPGRSHLLTTAGLVKDATYATVEHPAPTISLAGFPPDIPADPSNSKKKKPTVSSRGSSKGKQPPAKKPKALSAKDKKLQQQIQSVLVFDDEVDAYAQSTTQLKIEIVLSKSLIPRMTTPAVTKRPEEIVQPLPKLHPERLSDATSEFRRQIRLAIENIDADPDILKEQLKPSIVQIVKQLGNSKDPAFLAELRAYLLLNLNQTVNSEFDLCFPRPLPEPEKMTVEEITRRLELQKYHLTDDLTKLHEARCELDPFNEEWPYELALHLVDQNSPDCLKAFARAISINYSHKSSILGFCATLAKNNSRDDALVLLNMLYEKIPADPTLTVCLSIIYGMMESSKSDEFLAKISQMQKSPYLTAAAALLDVHDTFLSEIALSREQLQTGRTKDLLVLLARFSQQAGEFSRAQEYLKEALEFDREDLAVWKLLGEFQYAAGDREKARSSFQTLLSLCEEPDAASCLRLAILDIGVGLYDVAYDLLMYSVEHMSNALGWVCLGICCLRKGDYQEAEAALSEANELDRFYPITWGYCAVLCAKTDKWSQGERSLVLAEKLGLRDFKVIKEILELYQNRAEDEETASAINRMKLITEESCHPSLEPLYPPQNVSTDDENES